MDLPAWCFLVENAMMIGFITVWAKSVLLCRSNCNLRKLYRPVVSL